MVRFFLPFSLLAQAALCLSLMETECFRARSALPVLFHCQDLVDAIDHLARMPGENEVKAWGRRVPSTGPYTEHLPKVYYIQGQTLYTTCAVKVDVDRLDYFAVDSFRQSDVARSSGKVVDRCLLSQGMIGLDYPSVEGHVYVTIVRIDAPAVLEFSRIHHVQNISLPNSTSVLRIASGDAVINGGGVGHNGTSRKIDSK